MLLARRLFCASHTEVSLFAPTEFFDLSGFRYAAVFSELECVWEAVTRIHAFIGEHSPEVRLTGEESQIMPGAFLDGEPIVIGRQCVIEPGAYIRGPALIGDGVTIRHGAYIRGNALIGDGCLIGHATEVKNAILLSGAKAPHFAYVGDSILGNRVNLGAGTRLSNLKIARGHVLINVAGRGIDTGMRQLGAVLGDDAQTGCNVVLNPGTLVGPRSRIYPSAAVSGVVPPDTIVKLRAPLEYAQRTPVQAPEELGSFTKSWSAFIDRDIRVHRDERS
jgi:bifunctional UDP-N-acetylglucosamine pyrophosphorylase / glucosamine-1-phosphate N-acetyltransferase